MNKHKQISHRSKLIRKIVLIGVSLIAFICFLRLGSYIAYKTAKNMVSMNNGPEFYCYYTENDTNKVYGISSLQATRWSKKIDMMLSYYNYKFKGIPYEYSDMSFIYSIPNNTKVQVQEYIRDSSVVLVAYLDFNSTRRRVMPRKLYVPAYILHEKPLKKE